MAYKKIIYKLYQCEGLREERIYYDSIFKFVIPQENHEHFNITVALYLLLVGWIVLF